MSDHKHYWRIINALGNSVLNPKQGTLRQNSFLNKMIQARREKGTGARSLCVCLDFFCDSKMNNVTLLALRKIGSLERYIKCVEKISDNFDDLLKACNE